MILRYFLFLSILASLLAVQVSVSSEASDESLTAHPPGPGVEWTAVEDLNPNARATNRPIKQKWAVIVGLGKFKEKRLDNNLDLDRAAANFYDYAIDPNGGRFQKNHVKLLVNGESTYQNILASLGKSWLASLAGPDDLVVVFISTLGFPTTDGSSYLCAYDCALDNVYSTCLSIQNLMSILKQNVKTDRIVLILQACYSGGAELNSGAKSLRPTYNLDPDKLLLGKGYVILSSSQPDQMTWGDAFSRELVTALKENNGLTPLKEAFEKAKLKTEQDTALASSGGKKQTPVMKSAWTGKDLIIGIPPIETVSNLPAGVVNYLSAESHYFKANQLVALGNFDGATSEFQLAVTTDPQYANAYSDYGGLCCLKGDWQAAAEQYKKAIALNPEDSLFHANYARILAKLGKQDESRKQLEEAYRLNPKDRIVLLALSDFCLKEKSVAKALDLLEQAVALYPGSAHLHDRLSYVMAQQGAFDAAVDQANQALKLDPSLTSAYLNLGSSLLLKGETNGALTAYKEAAHLSPENADVHYCLSKLFERSGDITTARAELEQFLKLCVPTDLRLATERARLSRLTSEP